MHDGDPNKTKDCQFMTIAETFISVSKFSIVIGSLCAYSVKESRGSQVTGSLLGSRY